MKHFATQIGLLLAVAAASLAIGYAPTERRWGPRGLESMWAAAAICIGAALVAAVPMAVVARRWPAYIGQAALSGTAIRLLVTGGLAVIYQLQVDVHLTSFLTWLAVLYLLLLAVETGIGVALVRRHYRPPSSGGR